MIEAPLSGFPSKFPELLAAYFSQITDAVKKNSHHDHRRALLMDFLRKTFDIEVDEIELEKKVKAAEARGRIDAFYKFVIFEIKVDLEREHEDAVRELKKYFESREAPGDYVAAVTDGLKFEVYDYDSVTKKPKFVRSFTVAPNDPNQVYIDLDELLAAGHKVPPTSDDIVARFGLRSMTFLRAVSQLDIAFTSVEADSAVTVKFREWNALLAKVYGSAIGNKELFLRHTYLTILSKAIVTMVLFPKHHRKKEFFSDLLTGRFFRDQSIMNLCEPDFFSWALDNVAEDKFNEVFSAVFKRLAEFDWTRLDEDLLKMLYQELVDPSDRSGLGEYYTPDWLAEMILEDIGFQGGSLLDPSCGSGTFLFCAIRRLKRRGLNGDELVRYAMERLTGLDVHPVAVLMAKANILLALASELKKSRTFDIHLCVYMADTLHTEEKARKNFLGVPVGDGREFAIPLDSLENGRDLDQVIDQMVAFANRGATKETYEPARRGFLSKIAEMTVDEQNLWKINFELMVDLVCAKRDTVWGFILKNAFRPAYLRKTKVETIVGNPPWLSYRDIAEKSYKERVKVLVTKYDLLDAGSGNLVTRLDTSTLFYVHCMNEFLEPGGKIAFVMPKGVILPSKQHINFQRNGFSKIHDLGAVTVAGAINQHFFNVKCCVVEDTGEKFKTHVPEVVWSGQLPKKNLPLSQALPFLKRKEDTHELLSGGEVKSPYYYALSLQGATLVPRTLWSVDIDDSVRLNLTTPRVKTSEYAYKATKEEKWEVRLQGPVESEFLFGTVLGEDLLPFAVRHLTLYVLPVVVNGNEFRMLNHEDLLSRGFEHTSDWVKRAETIWKKRSKDENMNAQKRLNFQQLLVSQNPREPHVVLYNRSGTNISCAYLPSSERKIGDLHLSGFIADSVTHRIYCRSKLEANYLVGVLNSNIVNDAIKPYQTEGVYHGKRDIYRRPFEVCPIPEFDEGNPTHTDIAKLASDAKHTIQKWPEKCDGKLSKVREDARELVKDEIEQIDARVRQLLAIPEFREARKEPEKNAQARMF